MTSAADPETEAVSHTTSSVTVFGVSWAAGTTLHLPVKAAGTTLTSDGWDEPPQPELPEKPDAPEPPEPPEPPVAFVHGLVVAVELEGGAAVLGGAAVVGVAVLGGAELELGACVVEAMVPTFESVRPPGWLW
jgi:hypothetical protein